jgi:hypothetical protein
VFENKVPKRDEVTGKWRRLHSKEFHDLYTSPNIRMITLRIMRWAAHVARKGVRRSAHGVVVGGT